ncbi:hypothetical protein ACRAWF_06695 [Streptomyces sp. L7]
MRAGRPGATNLGWPMLVRLERRRSRDRTPTATGQAGDDHGLHQGAVPDLPRGGRPLPDQAQRQVVEQR